MHGAQSLFYYWFITSVYFFRRFRIIHSVFRVYLYVYMHNLVYRQDGFCFSYISSSSMLRQFGHDLLCVVFNLYVFVFFTFELPVVLD